MKKPIADLQPSPFSASIYSHEASEDLIRSIAAYGLLVPVWVTSDGLIISGHRRVNACKNLGWTEIDVEVKEYSDAVVIEANRYREKTWKEKLNEAEALRTIWEEKGKEKQTEGGIAKVSQNSVKPIDTQKEVARAIGTSHDTLHKLETINREKPELVDEIDEGKRSVHSAYNQVLRERQREEVREAPAPELPPGKYSTLVVDPPWPMEKIIRETRPNQSVIDYPVLSIEAIKDLPIPDIANDDAHLYLWTTHKYLPAAFQIIEAWGFKYQCLMTWVKNVGFTPFSWMYSTEHVLFCRKGNLPLSQLGLRLDFTAKVREHSRKPDEFYGLVAQASPGPRIDLFSREAREGFAQWGNEIAKF